VDGFIEGRDDGIKDDGRDEGRILIVGTKDGCNEGFKVAVGWIECCTDGKEDNEGINEGA